MSSDNSHQEWERSDRFFSSIKTQFRRWKENVELKVRLEGGREREKNPYMMFQCLQRKHVYITQT
jgi:hypothetical protein